MKAPVIVSLAIVLITNVVWAQDKADTTSISQPAVPGEHLPSPDHQADFTRENSEQIQPAQIPPFLRRTLQNNGEYTGWEEGMIYRNIQTNEFRLEIQHDQQRKVFEFDRRGNRVGKD